MPSEIIRDVGGLYDVVVEWNPEYTWLQIGLRTTNPAELGRVTGLFATLARDQVQQLITVARQARNDLYGADA